MSKSTHELLFFGWALSIVVSLWAISNNAITGEKGYLASMAIAVLAAQTVVLATVEVKE